LNPHTPKEKLRDSVEFINELCAVAKNVPDGRGRVFRPLLKYDFFEALAPCVQSPDLRIRTATALIISAAMEHDAAVVRSFISAEERAMEDSPEDQRQPLMASLVQQFVADPDLGMKTHLHEIIRQLLDAEVMEPINLPQKMAFIGQFYEHNMDDLVEPFTELGALDPLPEVLLLDPTKGAMYCYLCELLGMFVAQHTYHIRAYLIRKNLVAKALVLLRAKDKYVVLGNAALLLSFFSVSLLTPPAVFVPFFNLKKKTSVHSVFQGGVETKGGHLLRAHHAEQALRALPPAL